MTAATDEARRVAAGLSEAQKDAVRSGCCESGYDGCVCDFVPLQDFIVLGLVPSGGTYLNVAGLAVRAALLETQPADANNDRGE